MVISEEKSVYHHAKRRIATEGKEGRPMNWQRGLKGRRRVIRDEVEKREMQMVPVEEALSSSKVVVRCQRAAEEGEVAEEEARELHTKNGESN